jgi:hypothetical protein
MIRPVLAFGLLIALGVSANAATVHRPKLPEGRLRPSQHVAAPEHEHYTVPGWTDEQTRKWMTNPQVTD